MQGNTTEIDERNLLRLDALLSHGYGLSPQLVMRSKGLSIEAKALYGYLSSFAGAGDTAFPSTSRILEELDISKNRFYKIRKELVSWGFISIETTATSAGLRTVYTLPQNPIAIKTEIDEIANRRNEIKSSLVANLHNEDMVSHKGDSESERLQQSAGNEPCRQSEAKAQNRGSNLKPCLQSEDEGCLQSGDKLYIDTNINPKISIDRSATRPSDDEDPSDWKVTEGMTDPTDEIYIIDRAGEYTGISSRYGGVTYNFAVDSDTYLNPFDTVSVESLSPDAQLAFKIDAMLAQAGASAAEAGRDLGEEDQSIITRCVQEAFFDARQRGEQPPLLEDFYNKLLEQPEPEAKTIALRYERFVTGAQSFFNHQSNVDFKSRIVDFNLKDLPDSMLVFGLINVCEAVRNRMYFNAKRGVRTWLYVEEMQSLFAYPTVLNYFSRFSNEGRKFGLLLTGISQNAVAMLKNKAAQNLVLNSDFLLLLKQSPLDRAEWVRLLGLSEQEEEFIDESVEPGDGLLIAGGARVPIRGKFPSGNVLYDLFSTNPNEAADKKRMQEFAAREKSRLG